MKALHEMGNLKYSDKSFEIKCSSNEIEQLVGDSFYH